VIGTSKKSEHKPIISPETIEEIKAAYTPTCQSLKTAWRLIHKKGRLRLLSLTVKLRSMTQEKKDHTFKH